MMGNLWLSGVTGNHSSLKMTGSHSAFELSILLLRESEFPTKLPNAAINKNAKTEINMVFLDKSISLSPNWCALQNWMEGGLKSYGDHFQ